MFVANFIVLMFLGSKHVESPFVALGQYATSIYFMYFVVIVPLCSVIENVLLSVELYYYDRKG